MGDISKEVANTLQPPNNRFSIREQLLLKIKLFSYFFLYFRAVIIKNNKNQSQILLLLMLSIKVNMAEVSLPLKKIPKVSAYASVYGSADGRCRERVDDGMRL
jgi:hypothetical protein